MRKRIMIPYPVKAGGESDQGWLDLDQVATVEVTSEDASLPIESIFGLKDGLGWRASRPGEQQIRIIFGQPISLYRTRLRFDEVTSERTQEFVLRWSSARGGETTEIVRQQWNFSPTGSTTEIEHYVLDLHAVCVLELVDGELITHAAIGVWYNPRQWLRHRYESILTGADPRTAGSGR